MQATIDQFQFIAELSSFVIQLLKEAEDYQAGFEGEHPSLYIHALAQLFTESRGGESFDTLNDTGAKENLVAILDDLEAVHASCNYHLVMKLMTLLRDVMENYEATRTVSPAALVYAFCQSVVNKTEFLLSIESKDVLLAEMAEHFNLTKEEMLRFVQDYENFEGEAFNLYSWRNMDELEGLEGYIKEHQ